VIEVGASNAPAGTRTLAPPADTVPPAGPIEAVEEVVVAPADGASAGEPSCDEFDAGDEHATKRIAAATTGDNRTADEDMAHRSTAILLSIPAAPRPMVPSEGPSSGGVRFDELARAQRGDQSDG
jgi:hypothetical protein